MYDLRHENVNQFLGILCDSVRPAFIFSYNSRGSLYDVIGQTHIKLDWDFKLSLFTDLAKVN